MTRLAKIEQRISEAEIDLRFITDTISALNLELAPVQRMLAPIMAEQDRIRRQIGELVQYPFSFDNSARRLALHDRLIDISAEHGRYFLYLHEIKGALKGAKAKQRVLLAYLSSMNRKGA